jgi:tetratricopeptide (TPR) repeat protein
MKKPASSVVKVVFGLALVGNVLQLVAQDAKSYFETAKRPDIDQCTRLQLVCKAAELDAKKKEYRDACNATRIALIASDRDSLKRAHDFLDADNLKSASRYAGYVCKYNEVQYADAQQVLQQVKKLDASVAATPTPATPAAAPAKQDQNALFYSQAETQFEQGNFAAASSAANQVTDPNLKSLANQILQKIANYNSVLQDAQQKERNKDYDGAVKAYESALQISQGGPGDPASHIRDDERAQQQASAPITPTTPVIQQSQPSPVANKSVSGPKLPIEDDAAKIARLLDEAAKEAHANNLQEALKAYEAALRIQPANSIADAGRKDVQAAINRDPVEQAKTLSQAIRDFYDAKYSETEDELTTYLSSPTARSRGAAYFYLGATRLCVSILEMPGQKGASAIHNPEVQRPFKEAREANYQPLAKYLSPVVMRAWQSSSSTVPSGN